MGVTEESNGNITVELSPVMMVNPDDPEGPRVPSKTLFSILNGMYHVWYDEFSDKVRWSLASYDDKGISIPTHGAAKSVKEVVRICIANRKLRKEVENDLR